MNIFIFTTVLFSQLALPPLNTPEARTGWYTDYRSAYNVYKQDNRPMLLFFSASWCGPCKQLKKEFEKPELSNLRDKYILVYIDVDKEPRLVSWASSLNIWSSSGGAYRVPTILVIGRNRFGSRTGFMFSSELKNWLLSNN